MPIDTSSLPPEQAGLVQMFEAQLAMIPTDGLWMLVALIEQTITERGD